jgi:hypothetical protein
MLRSNETRIVKLEQARGARARRYVFYFDEVAEAEAQGLPYVLAPRPLSIEEWQRKYSPQPQLHGTDMGSGGAGAADQGREGQ